MEKFGSWKDLINICVDTVRVVQRKSFMKNVDKNARPTTMTNSKIIESIAPEK